MARYPQHVIRLNSWIDAALERRILLPLIVLVVLAIAFAAAFHQHDEIVEGFVGVVVLSLGVALGLAVALSAVILGQARTSASWSAVAGLTRGPPGRARGPTSLLAGFAPGVTPLLR